jgi:hypothetical protein
MPTNKDNLFHAKSGVAVLATCIVQTINEVDDTFRERFLDRLSRAYRELRDEPVGDQVDDLELLSWTRELLTGFSITNGQGPTFLRD